MAIQLGSFLLGAGTVLVMPLAARILRPVLVEVVATGLNVAEEATRVIAEQMEVMEDIAAEARAKREAASSSFAEEDEEMAGAAGDEDGDEAPSRPRPRRRETGGGRLGA
jgi:hypothetical protein